MPDPKTQVTGLILAGGRATRMGGTDKGLIPLIGKPMVAHLLERLRPQVHTVLINANRNEACYRSLGADVVADDIAGFAGPLAGMASGLSAATTDWVATVPCDSPLLPADLVERLVQALVRQEGDLAVAEGAGRLQPVFALLPRRLLPDLRDFLISGERKIDRWYRRHRMAVADLGDYPEAFLNVNTPEERDALEQRLSTATESAGGPDERK